MLFIGIVDKLDLQHRETMPLGSNWPPCGCRRSPTARPNARLSREPSWLASSSRWTRYEWRALSRRKFAIRAYDAAKGERTSHDPGHAQQTSLLGARSLATMLAMVPA